MRRSHVGISKDSLPSLNRDASYAVTNSVCRTKFDFISTKRIHHFLYIFGVFLLCVCSTSGFAAPTGTMVATPVAGGESVNNLLLIGVGLFFLGLLPFFFTMTTSFIKISVVFSLIRSALGTQQIPPNQVITGLAIMLTIYIMLPVGYQSYHQVEKSLAASQGVDRPELSKVSFPVLVDAAKSGSEPLRLFLSKHSSPRNRALFVNMSKRLYKDMPELQMTETDFWVVVPAFIITELSEAFQIGFLIFLPFLVVDMVVSNILLALGMFQLSPVTVALPFKLLIFVLVDGWYLIVQGLVRAYM